MFNKKKLILIIILFIGIFLRFYKLDWGDGIFPHPDERNIAWAVSNISFPTQMNPKFFAYGGFPIYLYYFTGYILDKIFPSQNIAVFDNYILIGRYWSAFFSSFSILIFFLLTKKLLTEKLALFATFLFALLPGVIQQAHFSTVETMISFFQILILYIMTVYSEKNKLILALSASVLLGVSTATKIVSLTFLPIVLVPVLLKSLKPFSIKKIPVSFLLLLFLTGISFISYIICSPFTFIDWSSFNNSMNYETGVGIGDPIVFYTKQFLNTTPIVFQLTKIFPYTLGLSVLISGIIGLLLLFIDFIKEKDLRKFLIIVAFLSYFLPNAILFSKWTRFMAPIFFFFPFFSAYFIYKIKNRKIKELFCFTIFITTFIWGMAFFSIYLKNDVRITASNWIVNNLEPKSKIFIESGNVIDIPLAGDFQRVGLDFFAVDPDNKKEELINYLSDSNYFIIQSRRVWANYIRLPETHAITAKFYPLLWSGKLGYEKIKEFDSFPVFGKIKFDDEMAEETFTVFDHPHISIYRKVKPYSKDYYSSLF